VGPKAGLDTEQKQSIPATRHGGAWGERRFSSYSFLTSALERMSGQRHALAALYPWGKNPQYPLYRRLGGPQSRSGHRGSASAGDRTSIARSSNP
jgi:hypothetical protein